MMDTSCSVEHNIMMHQRMKQEVVHIQQYYYSISILCDLAWQGSQWCVRIIIKLLLTVIMPPTLIRNLKCVLNFIHLCLNFDDLNYIIIIICLY